MNLIRFENEKIKIKPGGVLPEFLGTLSHTKYYLLTYFEPFDQLSSGHPHRLSDQPLPHHKNTARKIQEADLGECLKIIETFTFNLKFYLKRRYKNPIPRI